MKFKKINAFNVIVDIEGGCDITISGDNGYSYSTSTTSYKKVTITNAKSGVNYTVKIKAQSFGCVGSYIITSYSN